MNENRCVVCGAIIPESRQVCPICENKSKEQIEEMAKDMCEYCYEGTCYQDKNPCDCKCDIFTDAQYLYAKGYRKQSEGEWRGELRKRPDWRGKMQQYFQPNSCSVCHEAVVERTPYCPHCGAKMKGGAE